MVQQHLVRQGLLTFEVLRSQLFTQHLVEFLWRSDQPVAEARFLCK